MKVIKIEKCNFCPHYVHKEFMDISKDNKTTTRFNKDLCHYLLPHIIGINEEYNPLILIEIPDWCPLEDYKGV